MGGRNSQERVKLVESTRSELLLRALKRGKGARRRGLVLVENPPTPPAVTRGRQKLIIILFSLPWYSLEVSHPNTSQAGLTPLQNILSFASLINFKMFSAINALIYIYIKKPTGKNFLEANVQNNCQNTAFFPSLCNRTFIS